MKNLSRIFIFLFLPIFMQAQPSLDPNFNNDGILSIEIGPGSIAIQNDKKILIYERDGNKIIRLNVDNGIDRDFGLEGEVTLPVERLINGKIYVHPSGSILVAGSTREHDLEDIRSVIVVYMLNQDGSLNTDFGEQGKIFLNNAIKILDDDGEPVPGGSNYFSTLAVQPDGKIVISGSASFPTNIPTGRDIINFNRLTTYRIDVDGSLDTSFGEDGIRSIPVSLPEGGEITSWSNDMKIQPDGKIVIVGYATWDLEELSNPILLRLNQDGTLDSNFNNGNILLPSVYQTENYAQLIIYENGEMLVGGYYTDWSDWEQQNAFFKKLDQNGILLTQYGQDGYIHDEEGGQLLLLPDEYVLVSTGSRITPEGEINKDFSVYFSKFAGRVPYFPHMALQDSDQLIITGSGSNSISDNMQGYYVARLQTFLNLHHGLLMFQNLP